MIRDPFALLSHFNLNPATLVFTLFGLFVSTSFAADQASEPRIETFEYARPGRFPLTLDLYRSAVSAERLPVVVFVHGGGWKNGSKASGAKTAAWLTEHGYAVASIDFRMTDVASWPAPIDDCYAAVRWLRENGQRLQLDTQNIGAWGTSSGGHLVALLGTRPNPEPESISSRVQAVCDWFGPTDLLTMPPNNVGEGRTAADVANSNGAKLLGATVRDVPPLAQDASALYQVSSDDAAFLIMHGDADSAVPLDQSERFYAALVAVHVDAQLIVLPGAGHGGGPFTTPASRAAIVQFFDHHLRP